jgi:predicted HTH transcriptional regulator
MGSSLHWDISLRYGKYGTDCGNMLLLKKEIVRELLLNAINHKDYASGVPIQVSIYDDKIVIFNMGEWSKRVPTDISIYERHESVPHNPKIADVSFRSGDVESWGRGYIKIKADCKHINAELPIIDANGGGVSVTACGCEKYMRLLRYGQYGQVGVDGVWRDKDTTKITTKASNEALNEALDEALENKLLAEINNNPYIKQNIL